MSNAYCNELITLIKSNAKFKKSRAEVKSMLPFNFESEDMGLFNVFEIENDVYSRDYLVYNDDDVVVFCSKNDLRCLMLDSKVVSKLSTSEGV